MTMVKIKNWRHEESHKHNGIDQRRKNQIK